MRILVVEDDPKHMTDAVNCLQAAGHEVIQQTNAIDAVQLLGCSRIDGVITDLFLPDGVSGLPYPDEPDQPRGLAVVLIAKYEEIPCIICTAGYHHEVKYNWINWLLPSLGLFPMIDSVHLKIPKDQQGESASKDWKRALENLLATIEAKKKPKY